MNKDINTGDAFRLLGSDDIWMVAYCEGKYNLLQVDKNGWITSDSKKLFDGGFYTLNELIKEIDAGFIFLGNMYRDDDFIKEYF